MRFEAATAAGELGLTGGVRPLIRLLDDPDSSVREAAALALGQIGGPEAKRALQASAAGADERLAQAAEEALQELSFNSEGADQPLFDFRGTAAAGSGSAADEEDDVAPEAEAAYGGRLFAAYADGFADEDGVSYDDEGLLGDDLGGEDDEEDEGYDGAEGDEDEFDAEDWGDEELADDEDEEWG